MGSQGIFAIALPKLRVSAAIVNRVLKVFCTRKMASILVLGFASGFPFYLTSRTLQAWMTVAGVDLTTTGLFGLAGLPYSLKFLWSPVIDRYSFPFLGRRKGWLFSTQAVLALAIAAMALAHPPLGMQILAVNVIAIALLSATQDITIDAYTADLAVASEVGAASGTKVLGYRMAMIATGGGALVLADHVSWQTVYFLLGGVMLLLAAYCTRVPEPALRERPPQSLRDAALLPLLELFARLGKRQAACIIAFIVFYRLGDAMINNMTTPFLIQTGFSPTEIGIVQGGLGLFATIAGVAAGGALMSAVGLNRSLWIFGFLQAASNLAYLALAYAGHRYSMLVGAILVENICSGFATAGLVGFIMSACNPRFSATQYALLSSLIAVGRDVVAAPSGRLAQSAGWPAFFLISVAAAAPGMLLLPYFAPWRSRRGV